MWWKEEREKRKMSRLLKERENRAPEHLELDQLRHALVKCRRGSWLQAKCEIKVAGKRPGLRWKW